MTGHGNVRFSDVELRNLRRYLEQGGFLHADDQLRDGQVVPTGNRARVSGPSAG